MTPKKYNGDLILKLAKALKAGNSTPYSQAMSKTFGNDLSYENDKLTINNANNYFKDMNALKSGAEINASVLNDDSAKVFTDTLNKANNVQNIDNGVSIGQLGKLGLNAAETHPFKAAGLGALGLGNIGGFVDNNKFGGQVGGLALGGLGAKMLASGNPYAQAMLTLGGGELGALFDKLRAKREQEQLPQNPNYYR